MYLLNRDVLKKGDIILTCSEEKPSKIIRTLTRSEYSHAILYVGEASYIHSDLSGVHSGNTQRLVIEDVGDLGKKMHSGKSRNLRSGRSKAIN